MKNRTIALLIVMSAIFSSVLTAAVHEYLDRDTAADWKDNAFLGTIEIICSDPSNSSYGTGFIIDSDGPLVVTNAHGVVYGNGTETTVYQSIQGKFCDSDTAYDLTCILHNSESDIALLRFDDLDREYNSLIFGDSYELEYGDELFAIGNARGYGLSFSAGVVSIPLINISESGNVRRSIQTTIPINDGNSGGPLFDKGGNVAGMISFRMRDQYGEVVQGTSYAIPSDVIREFIRESSA